MHDENVAPSILRETLAAIAAILGSEPIVVERVVVGLFFTGVKLTNGIAGACATPLQTIQEAFCCPSSPAETPFRGRPAFDLAREALHAEGIRRAVGIAATNALADLCWRRRPHPLMELKTGDAFDATRIAPGERVVVVGAFVPFLKALKARRQPFLVLEQDPATLKADELPFFRPAETAAEIVPAADVLLITGATLLNDTLEHLLRLARPAERSCRGFYFAVDDAPFFIHGEARLRPELVCLVSFERQPRECNHDKRKDSRRGRNPGRQFDSRESLLQGRYHVLRGCSHVLDYNRLGSKQRDWSADSSMTSPAVRVSLPHAGTRGRTRVLWCPGRRLPNGRPNRRR